MNHMTTVTHQNVMHNASAYHYWMNRARYLYEASSPWWDQTRREMATNLLAQEMIEVYGFEAQRLFKPHSAAYMSNNVLRSLLDAALGAVDWHEVAGLFVDELPTKDTIRGDVDYGVVVEVLGKYVRDGTNMQAVLEAVKDAVTCAAELPYIVGARDLATIIVRTCQHFIEDGDFPGLGGHYDAWCNLQNVLRIDRC